MVVTILFFLLILGVIVISHEFGHFLVAKKNGIHVVEFSIGFGPKLFGFTKNETEYTLRLLPLGGACRFEGVDMTPDEVKEIAEKAEDGTDGFSDRAFQKTPVWSRIATVVAGPLFNFLLAFLFSLVVVSTTYTALPKIVSVSEGGGADLAGIKPGDTIKEIDGKSIDLYDDVVLQSVLSNGETTNFIINRDGKDISVDVTPQFSNEDGRFLFGFTGGEYVKGKGLEVVKFAFYEMRYSMRSTYSALLQLITGKGKKDNVMGPVGIAQVVGNTYEETKEYGMSTVILNMMYLAMLLSVNLGIINLLPLPAIDGGRLVFLLIELIRGKPVPPEKEGMVHLAGVVLLLCLAVFVCFNDVARLLR